MSGDLTGFVADFVLDSSSGQTFASDLSLLIASTPAPDLDHGDDVLFQIGGTASPLAPLLASWGTGNGATPGTTVQTTLQTDTPIPLDEVYVFLGNGWLQGSGVWSGSIDIVDLAPATGPIVAASPTAGTVAPGEAITVQVDVSAAELVEGTYTGQVQVASNDPVRPLELFELTLDVSGTPALSFPETALDFGELFIGQTGSEELVVTNTGSAALTLSDFEVDDTAFQVATESLVVEAGESASVPIDFTAAAAGEVAAALSFASDDPNNASVAVPLSATVLETPALVVEPASIEAALAAGETGTASVELSNPGSGLLEFEFPDFAASDGAGSGALAGAAVDQPGWVRVETDNATHAGTVARAARGVGPEAEPLSNRSASLEIAIESFEAFGGEFVPVATDLSGALDRIDADFVLEQATGLTWANDLALIITEGPEVTADSILLQVGGTFTWPMAGFAWTGARAAVPSRAPRSRPASRSIKRCCSKARRPGSAMPGFRKTAGSGAERSVWTA